MDRAALKSAHGYASQNREALGRSATAGCFFCQQTYSASLVVEWTDEGQTALCPRCGIDSVVGDDSGLPVADLSFLSAMNEHWFAGAVAVDPVVSLADLRLDAWEQGTLYKSADISFGRLAGLRNLGASYNEVPAGKSSCPFHNHHQEDEMFIVLEGEGTYRFGEGRYAFKAGDVLIAPAGDQSTAHQIINTGSRTLRYIGVSTMAATEVCEYPDSGKFGVFSRTTGNPTDKSTLRHLIRDGQAVDYWDGEPGA